MALHIDKLHFDRKGLISRVVPGQLLYIETEVEPSSKTTIAIKPDHVFIRRDSDITPYRGEAFEELGLLAGKEVVLCIPNSGNGIEYVIITEESHRKIYSTYILAAAVAAALALALKDALFP